MHHPLLVYVRKRDKKNTVQLGDTFLLLFRVSNKRSRRYDSNLFFFFVPLFFQWILLFVKVMVVAFFLKLGDEVPLFFSLFFLFCRLLMVAQQQ
jgi:hypothetical protein